MTDRCEPPETLRDVDGWHWIKGPNSTWPLLWINTPQGYVWRRPGNDDDVLPETAANLGGVYLCPVPSPDTIIAMGRRTELLALAARVANGEAGQKLNQEISRACGWTLYGDGMGQTNIWTSPEGVPHSVAGPNWTSSIDAQMALPAWIMRVEVAEDPNLFVAHAIMKVGRTGINLASRGTAASEPAARLAALLYAMAADEL